MDEALQRLLAYTGVLLFFLGLLTGAAIPFVRSPRIGLSAHVAAIQSGLALVAVAWLGSHLDLSPGWASGLRTASGSRSRVVGRACVRRRFGTGRTLPLAGKGFAAERWQELTAAVLIGGASIASALAFGALLLEWSWRPG